MSKTYSISINKLIILGLIKFCVSDETVQVKLEEGAIIGKVEQSLYKQQHYFSFKGIPYAKPPVGELRFMPPTPHRIWENSYEAYDNKPTCLQFSSRKRNDEPFGISGSEDCLYISVFTPDLQESAPVVVFDYNDNFRTAFNGTDTYSPEFFVEEGVIVVTISHRLGIFGYLTTEDDVILGNNGLRDFILGLQWIKDNIKLFGGDPDRVTLMGSCGGAATADMLLYSDKAKGLFSAVIIQSGTSLESLYFHKTPRAKAFELGKQVNIHTNDSKTLLQELQSVDAEQLLTKEVYVIDDDSANKYQHSTFPFAPTIEHNSSDAVLSFLPEDATIINDVPVIIGLNSGEGLDLASHFLFEPKLLSHGVEENVLVFPIRPSFRFDSSSSAYKEARKEILEFYFEDKSVHYGNILEYATYAGDVLQNYALNYAAKKIAADLESPVFYYMFDFRGQLNENSQYITRYSRYSTGQSGATIVDELCYLHLCTRIRKDYEDIKKLPSDPAEIKVLRKMVRLWTNFAKTRNPTPDKNDDILQNFAWEPIKKGSADMNYLHITKKLKIQTNPLGERAKFWDGFLAKYSQLAVDGVVRDQKESHDEL